METPPLLFISYSHDSDEHKEIVLSFSERLRDDGFHTILDQYLKGAPAEKWPRWMLNQIDKATFVLVVCTETYYRRFRGHAHSSEKGRGVDWEGAIITQEIYDARSSCLKFVPVMFAPNDRYIPEPLRGQNQFILDSEKNYKDLCDLLGGIAGVEARPVGKRVQGRRRRGSPLKFEDSPLDINARSGESPSQNDNRLTRKDASRQRYRIVLRRLLVCFLLIASTVTWSWIGMAVRAIRNQQDPPLTVRQMSQLDQAIGRLTSNLAGEYQYMLQRDPADLSWPNANTEKYNAWNLAQITVALCGSNQVDIDREGTIRLFHHWMDRELNCWRGQETDPRSPPHVGATSWVILAFSVLREPASREQIEFLLENQNDEGSWGIYPGGGDNYGSTYATGWAAYALHSQLAREFVSEDQQARTESAINRAVRWLHDAKIRDTARWHLYPAYSDLSPSISNSGLIVHVLGQLEPENSTSLSTAWLKKLPTPPSEAYDWESFSSFVEYRSNDQRQLTKESVRCLVFPWLIIGTADAYHEGNLLERLAAIEVFDVALEQSKDLDSQLSSHSWIAAELLIALRYLRGTNAFVQ